LRYSFGCNFYRPNYSWLKHAVEVLSTIKKEEEAMYFSRVIIGKVDPNKHEEAFVLFTDIIIPAAREQEGFRGANLFSKPRTGQFIATTIWKTEADMISSDKSGYLKGQLDKVANLFTEQPLIDHYNVLY
jgi:heme-degrading monooxygenase HmoA